MTRASLKSRPHRGKDVYVGEDLCRGWTEEQVIEALQSSTPLARKILRSMAQNPGITAEEIARDIGAAGMTTVAGSLSSWYQNVTRPLGVKDPATGKDSWPFLIKPSLKERSNTPWRYFMPQEVAAIVLRHTSADL